MAFNRLCYKQPFSNEAGNTKKRALVYAKKFDGQEDESKVLFLMDRLGEIKSPFCLLIDELHYHQGNKCLAIMAASVDGSFNRFVFLRWFKSSDAACDNNKIFEAYKSCLEKLSATGNRYCVGGVADGNFSNDGVRDLDTTCLWDYRHLEKILGKEFEQIDVILRQVYTNTTFTPDNYERTFAHYSRLITEDVLMRTETKDLCQQQLGKIKKVCGRYFSVSQEPLTLFNVNNNILETAGLKLNNYADKYGLENGYDDEDRRRLWLLSAAMEDIKLPRPPPPAPAPAPAPAPEDPPHDAPGPDRRRTGGMRGMQRHMPMYRRQT